MSFQTKIPCPDCGTDILVDSMLLLGGHSFSCTGCAAVISLDESSAAQVKETLEAFEKLKQESAGTARADAAY